MDKIELDGKALTTELNKKKQALNDVFGVDAMKTAGLFEGFYDFDINHLCQAKNMFLSAAYNAKEDMDKALETVYRQAFNMHSMYFLTFISDNILNADGKMKGMRLVANSVLARQTFPELKSIPDIVTETAAVSSSIRGHRKNGDFRISHENKNIGATLNVVCDGHSEHDTFASVYACYELAKFFRAAPFGTDRETLEEKLINKIINIDIDLAYLNKFQGKDITGTTLAMVIEYGDEYLILNIGDSPIFLKDKNGNFYNPTEYGCYNIFGLASPFSEQAAKSNPTIHNAQNMLDNNNCFYHDLGMTGIWRQKDKLRFKRFKKADYPEFLIASDGFVESRDVNRIIENMNNVDTLVAIPPVISDYAAVYKQHERLMENFKKIPHGPKTPRDDFDYGVRSINSFGQYGPGFNEFLFRHDDDTVIIGGANKVKRI